ncbi:MlaD family protein [Desertivirga xinjiangensis]|uniref:MlaD family protein n=1 Tax=Desertivirga xinjiangensis TaxID=539206 RepID=UPI002109D08C|nr:MlaD family protein [Pedobacter xinjiangensis]
MKTSISQKIKIGFFTIAGILLFVAGIFLIGSKKNMFDDTFMIYGTFKNIGGLEVGNNIRFAGITVGTVKDIRIVSDTLIRVDMTMKSDVRPFLKKDALASIGSDGLMGDKLVTIASGSANEARLLRSGSQIMTVNPVDVDRVVGKLINVAGNAEIITRELAGMAMQIKDGKGSISSLLYTDNLSKSLEGTARNAENITGSLAGMARQMQSGKGSIGNLMYTNALSDRLDSTLTKASAALVTINEASYGFSENMKALHGNIFFRGYFRRKAREAAQNADLNKSALNKDYVSADFEASDMNEAELKEIISEAQKALAAKQLDKNK